MNDKYLVSEGPDFKVLSEEVTADTVTARDPAHGQASGTYRQSVRLPKGDVVEVHGTYTAEWLRAADGTWQMERITAVPAAQ